MFDRRYQSASVLLYDPQTAMRHATRIALLNLGFGEVEAVRDFEQFMKLAESGDYDLIVGDTRSGGGDTCAFVQKIRRNDVGRNPFINVIVTLWDTTPEQVHAIIGAGADDLISRPMSSSQLGARVNGLVFARKPFVVTGDYIGPERRQIIRGLAAGAQMVVPNSLQAKVENKPEVAATPANIAAALQAVNNRKISIYTEQFLSISTQILSLATDLGQLDERHQLIEVMRKMNEDLQKRIVGTEFSHVLALCEALDNILKRNEKTVTELKDQEKELLSQIPFAIHKACSEVRQSADLAFDIRDLSTRVKTARM